MLLVWKIKFTGQFLNVIDNAIKYTPEDNTVTISLYKKEKMAMIHVKDTGSGISEKTLLTYLIVSIEVLKQRRQ